MEVLITLKRLKIRTYKYILVFLMLVIVQGNTCIGQVVFYDINNNSEDDFIINAASFGNEIYFVSKTGPLFMLNHIDSLGALLKSEEVEWSTNPDAMLIDEEYIYICKPSVDQSILLIYDRTTFDLVDKLSFDFPHETTAVVPIDIQFFESDKIVISTTYREVDPPDYCSSGYGSLVVVDKNTFELDTVIKFYEQQFCSNTVLGMRQIDNRFVVAVEGSRKWEEGIPFYENKDEMYITEYNENFEVVEYKSHSHQVFDPDFVWFDLFDKFERCLTSGGDVLVPVRYGPYQCPHIDYSPGCIPYNSLLSYNGIDDEPGVLANSFNTFTLSADIRSMVETDGQGLVFFGEAHARFFPNYDYNVMNGMQVDLTDEPYVFTQTPIFLSINNEGYLEFRLVTMLDEEYNSDLKNITHLFQLENGNLVALGNGLEDLSPTGSRFKLGDIYAMFIDENFCVEGYGCIEEG